MLVVTKLFTGCNEVVAKVMFLLVSFILLTRGVGSVCLSACWDATPQSRPPEQTPPLLGADTPQEQIPPREQTPPPPGSRHPPRSRHPPWSRHPREQTPPGADTPGADTPPASRHRYTVNERPVRILLECILV